MLLGTHEMLSDGFLVERVVAEEGDRDEVVVGVVPDEVDDNEVVLACVLTEAAPQLLDKDNGRLGLAQHDHLIDRGDVHPFVEDVDRQDVVEVAMGELSQPRVRGRRSSCSRQRNGSEQAPAQLDDVQSSADSATASSTLLQKMRPFGSIPACV